MLKQLSKSIYPTFFLPVANNYKKLYQKLVMETAEHIQYLTKIGLEERAKKIKVNWFKPEKNTLKSMDLSSFEKRTFIPKVVMDFNQHLKNTIITTDPNEKQNKPEEINLILEIFDMSPEGAIKIIPYDRDNKNYNLNQILGSGPYINRLMISQPNIAKEEHSALFS